MNYKPEVFMSQFPIVKRFAYHFIYYRMLQRANNLKNLNNDFWVITIDAHFLQAVNNWCMVFGSDGCNQTHWKNISMQESEILAQSFRNNLFQETGLDTQALRDYCKQIIDFRNNYAAHRALNFSKKVPFLDNALEIVNCYDRWVRSIIFPDILAEPLLNDFSRDVEKSFLPLMNQLLSIAESENSAMTKFKPFNDVDRS